MKATGYFVAGALCAAAVTAIPKVLAHLAIHAGHTASQAPTHSHEEFSFTANGPIDQVAPLFGADKERLWAAGWDPQFLFPSQPADKEGMVFTIDRHHRQEVWVNTELDLLNGRMQYVYVVPDVMATLITLCLTSNGDKTHVAVTYERTALSISAEDHVRRMAEEDRKAGPEWEKAVNDYLSKN